MTQSWMVVQGIIRRRVFHHHGEPGACLGLLHAVNKLAGWIWAHEEEQHCMGLRMQPITERAPEASPTSPKGVNSCLESSL